MPSRSHVLYILEGELAYQERTLSVRPNATICDYFKELEQVLHDAIVAWEREEEDEMVLGEVRTLAGIAGLALMRFGAPGR